MAVRTETSATKAMEWMVDQLSAASNSGWWAEKLTALTTSSPAYKTTAVSAPSMPRSSPTVDDIAREQAARAESDVTSLSHRVTELETELGLLKRSYEKLAAHLEEAVGPHEEGEHRSHWWSRR